MKISVAMTSYNGEKYIAEQIDSVLNNLREDDELVISDDGSVDKTKEIIKSFKDKRIRLIGGPKRGVKQNFAKAIDNCKGEIIFLADQDDVWSRDKVKKMLRIFEEKNCDLVIHDCEVFDSESGKVIEKSFFKWRGSQAGIMKNIWKNSYIGCCMAFKTKMKKYILPIPDNIEMHDQWIGVLCEKYGKVNFLKEQLIRYRMHSDQNTGLKRHSIAKMVGNRMRFVKEYCKRCM